MAERARAAATFLAGAGWGDADQSPLAGDASGRRYQRLTRPAGEASAVFMDAPPEVCGSIESFCRIARVLLSRGLSAPVIRASDPTAGFLLLEDLGDDLFARVIARDPSVQHQLYAAATEVLIALRAPPPDGLADADAITLTALTDLAFSQYRAGAGAPRDPKLQEQFRRRFHELLASVMEAPKVLLLRDYHAENLLWLPDRDGLARVGLLDFQDAMAGPAVYDLVSLLQDARRDVPPETEQAMIERYCAGTGEDRDAFGAAYAVIGVQRHLRILGVFARLSMEQGKTRYIDLIPRVWAHLMRDLDHPALRPVAGLLRDALPPPDTQTLRRLKGGNQ